MHFTNLAFNYLPIKVGCSMLSYKPKAYFLKKASSYHYPHYHWFKKLLKEIKLSRKNLGGKV